MMGARSVWRYDVDPSTGVIEIPTPGDAKVLSIGWSHAGLSVWIEVEPDAPKSITRLYVIGTGWPVPEGARHVGTYTTTPSAYVWHLYVPEVGSDD
jgi:hypothetical protein